MDTKHEYNESLYLKVERLKRALLDEGINPSYHRFQLRKLKSECPVIWNSIVDIVGDEPYWMNGW